MATFKKFFIGNRQIQIELSPQLANTLDESLDNLSVNEIANDIENPYTPFQRFYVKDENNNIIQTFIISADNVELKTVNPNRYVHHLSLVQLSEFLTKHEIRNTVFSSDQDNELMKYVSASIYTENMEDKYPPGAILETIYYKNNPFAYISDKVDAEIDLSKKSINQMSFKISFNYQAMVSHAGGSGAHSITMDYRKPSKWADIYVDSGGTPTNLPKIKFTIGGEDRELTLSNSDYSNGDVVYVPENILTWIQSFSSGTLTITIENETGNNTFMIDSYFNGRRVQVGNPWFVNICYMFYINTSSVNYNIYSVIDTLLKEQMKETTMYNSSNDSDYTKPLFLLPTLQHNADLYNLLKSTQVPNFIFTQSSMYDALAEIFKLFDAIFTIDKDGYLDIEYFNEQAQTPMNKPSQAGQSKSLSEERFTNKLITYFQNTKINDKFPNSNNESALAYLRSKKLGVPSENDYVFIVPKPIDIVLSAKIKARVKFNSSLSIRYDGTVHYLYLGSPTEDEPLDISNYIVEESIWSILPNGQPPINGNWGNIGKFNTLAYTRGSNYISVSEYKTTTLNQKNTALQWVLNSAMCCMMGIGSTQNESIIDLSTPNWRDVQMSVEYIALVDGKLVNESLDFKYNGETLINQSNGSIDINKLGLNMVGLGLKLGQPTLNMTQVFTTWSNRVRKGQYFVDDNGDRWVANNCVYTAIKPDLIQTNIEFVKNFNGLAKRIELNSEKRLSNISNELTTKCEETYGEFIYYSSGTDIDQEMDEAIAIYKKIIMASIGMSVGYPMLDSNNKPITTKIEYTVLTPYNKNNSVINVTELGNLERICIPLMVYGSGNSVCFEMSYESPISAGNQLLDDYTSSLWDGGWFSRAVLYTAEDGTFDNCDIEFIKLNEGLNRNFPLMRGLSMEVLGKLGHFKYYKKPNEIFALNYQLHFLPVNKNFDFLSNEFIKNNGFANGLNPKKLFIYCSYAETYSILDTKVVDTAVKYDITSVTFFDYYADPMYSQYNLRFFIRFITGTIYDYMWNSMKSWALADKDGNIYFASNRLPKNQGLSNGQFQIIFMSRHHRLS